MHHIQYAQDLYIFRLTACLAREVEVADRDARCLIESLRATIDHTSHSWVEPTAPAGNKQSEPTLRETTELMN